MCENEAIDADYSCPWGVAPVASEQLFFCSPIRNVPFVDCSQSNCAQISLRPRAWMQISQVNHINDPHCFPQLFAKSLDTSIACSKQTIIGYRGEENSHGAGNFIPYNCIIDKPVKETLQ